MHIPVSAIQICLHHNILTYIQAAARLPVLIGLHNERVLSCHLLYTTKKDMGTHQSERNLSVNGHSEICILLSYFLRNNFNTCCRPRSKMDPKST